MRLVSPNGNYSFPMRLVSHGVCGVALCLSDIQFHSSARSSKLEVDSTMERRGAREGEEVDGM